MALISITSPHAHGANKTGALMQTVLLGTLPGLIALTVFFGFGTIINLVLACLFAVLFESAVLFLRRRPILFYLADYSALVTAALLGLALPPYVPWWIVAIGIFFAIVVAKHLYGGLGFNPFNPAMVGYVVLLISFPLEMSQWAAPLVNLPEHAGPDLLAVAQQVFGGGGDTNFDAFTAATPLDVVRQNSTVLLQDLYAQSPSFARGRWAGTGWEWVNLTFLAGGLYLLYKKLFTWHAPVSMLLALGIMAAIFYDGGSSTSSGSPLFHWFSGASMLGAFFIVTDPVTSATSNKGRFIYGFCIGLLVFIIRYWGNYPDAVAFAVLLMNFAAPFIDYYTTPRTYGHNKSQTTTSARK